MHCKAWLTGIVAGTLAGLAVAVPATIADWRMNPAGLFHDDQGTDWSIVLETGLSWFWPVAVAALLVTVAVRYWRFRDRPG